MQNSVIIRSEFSIRLSHPFIISDAKVSDKRKNSLTTLCLLGNFTSIEYLPYISLIPPNEVIVICRFFSKLTTWKISVRNTIRVSNSLNPDRARHKVGPDLGPNCLQRLSADGTSRLRVNLFPACDFF